MPRITVTEEELSAILDAVTVEYDQAIDHQHDNADESQEDQQFHSRYVSMLATLVRKLSAEASHA